jgi:transposase
MMSKNKRKQYSPQFKAKVALEAARGDKTVAELSSQYDLHPTVVNNWKRQLLDGASDLFESGRQQKAEKDTQEQIKDLYRHIGQLKVERDFLAERSEILGLKTEKSW